MLMLFCGTLLACKPTVEEPIDEEAYALCEALYDHQGSCGDDIDADSTETCARNATWQGPCRDLRTEQFECFTALTCEDEESQSVAFATCEAKRHATSLCSAEHRDDP